MTDLQPERLATTVDRCPFDFYAKAREDGLYFDERDQAWIASSYETVKSICTDEDTFARVKPIEVVPSERYVRIVGGNRHASGLVGQERIDHRRWWLSLFTRAKVEAYRDGIVSEVIEAQLDRIAPLGRADLGEDYASRVSMGAIAGILGLPWDDEDWMQRFRRCFEMVEHYKSLAYVLPDEALAMVDETLKATEEADELIRPFLERARHDDDGSILAQVWHHPSLAQWTVADRFDTVRTFFGAGSGSTGATMANALHMLLTQANVFSQVARGDAQTVANFVEESLRLSGAVQFRTRLVTRDVMLEGHSIARGDKVVAILSSANRDENQYSHADEVDLDRQNPRSHVAFLAGLGTCGGSAIARVELQEGIGRIVKRLPLMKLDLTYGEPVMEGLGLRMVRPLHVTFPPESRQ